jgi:UMF1 family MFS transporter
MYDWANSVYSLAIATAVYPIYFSAVAPDSVPFAGGFSLNKSSLYSYAVSLAYLLIVVLSPVLGGIADARGLKKRFLAAACICGSVAVLCMFFFTGDTLWLGVALFVLAGFFWGMSEIFYNSLLPDVATEDRFDSLSARGYSLGYIGSSIQLIVALVLIFMHESFGISEGTATRLMFIFTGAWWGGFGLWALSRIARRRSKVAHVRGHNVFVRGFKELWACAQDLVKIRILFLFLITFLVYDTAIQTVMYVATPFGKNEIKLDTTNLILVLLIIQFIAIPGAILFGRLSERYGNIFALRLVLVIWIGICIMAYFITLPLHFYLLGALVGLVMGAVQSTSRATYTKLIPEEHRGNASFFSFYSMLDKVAIVLGMATFGYVNELTGSMRSGILFLITWLAIGLVLLYVVPWRKLFTGKHATTI